MENKETEKMLELLEKDSTMPIDELADLLSLPVEKAQALKDKATHEGLIIGYQAVIDWDKVADELSQRLDRSQSDPAKGDRLRQSGPRDREVR
jgi:DNA-binding Lrp family transcriptional regulator